MSGHGKIIQEINDLNYFFLTCQLRILVPSDKKIKQKDNI